MASESVNRFASTEHERLQLFIDSIVDYAILSLDRDGRISSWNRGAERLKGYSAQEIIGQHFSIFYSPADREDGLPEHLLSEAREQGHVEHTGWRVRKDGTHFWGNVVISAVRNDANELLGFTKITRDLTERKQAEDRERLLTNDLERANRMKSEFLANMSHEVRTPLNGIIGMLTLMLDTDLSVRQLDYAETAARSSEALLRIVNDILDFSKIEAGKLELETVPFTVRSIVDEMEALFTPQLRTKDVHLVTEVSADMPPIMGDPGRLRQIIANLLGNAIKFTQQGRVTCSARLKAQRGDSVTIRVEVTDTGIGLRPEDRQRLFEAFSQADISTTRRFGGTGLGLTICRQLLSLMHSEMHIESEPGKGSSFWFELECAIAPQELLIESTTSRSIRSEAETLTGRVLVAEDNDVNQKVVASFLQSFGCNVTVVADGNEVLIALAESDFDVILMDCQMPNMDGFETTRRVRALKSVNAGIPIIAVTASALPEERARCFASGMNDFIAKPLAPDVLRAKLSMYLPLDDPTPTEAPRGYVDLLQQSLGDEIHTLIATFVKSTNEQLHNIENALKAGRFDDVARYAHKLKGSSSALGFTPLYEAAQDIEEAAAQEDLGETMSSWNDASQAFESACIQLESASN